MPPRWRDRTSISVQARFQTQGFGGNALFGAGSPLVPPDPMPVRVYDFVVGENRVQTPRAYEPFTFANLRAFANVELVRLAIETRKDQIERLQLARPVQGREEAEARRRGAHRQGPGPAAQARRRHDFATWLKALLEDLFVLDAPGHRAPAHQRRRADRPRLRARRHDQAAGGRHRPPPAPRSTPSSRSSRAASGTDLTDRDLIYRPRNVRTNHLYGFGPVEQIVVTINTLLQRQTRQLAWFTEGNTPPGVMSAPEGWSPDQIKQYQDWFDERLRGNAANRSGIIWGPFGAKYSPFKDPPLKDDFDEWLARIVCYCFNLPPTPFIKQMNRATGETDAERALEEGLEPTKLGQAPARRRDPGRPRLRGPGVRLGRQPRHRPEDPGRDRRPGLRNGSTTSTRSATAAASSRTPTASARTRWSTSRTGS
jgi:hypothetical protein